MPIHDRSTSEKIVFLGWDGLPEPSPTLRSGCPANAIPTFSYCFNSLEDCSPSQSFFYELMQPFCQFARLAGFYCFNLYEDRSPSQSFSCGTEVRLSLSVCQTDNELPSAAALYKIICNRRIGIISKFRFPQLALRKTFTSDFRVHFAENTVDRKFTKLNSPLAGFSHEFRNAFSYEVHFSLGWLLTWISQYLLIWITQHTLAICVVDRIHHVWMLTFLLFFCSQKSKKKFVKFWKHTKAPI